MASRRTRAAAAASGSAAVLEPELPIPIEGSQGQQPVADPKQMYFFDYLRTLDKGLLSNALVYVYRIFPEIKNQGEYSYIDRIGAQVIDEEWLKTKHGGGKYQLWLNTDDKEKDVKRVVSIAGPAKIFPTHVLVDPTTGEPAAPALAAAAPGAKPLTETDLVNVLKTVIEGVKHNDKPTEHIVGEIFSIMKQANSAAVDVVRSAAGNGGTDPAILRLLEKLTDKIEQIGNQKPAEDPTLVEIKNQAIKRFLDPPVPVSTLDTLKQLAELKSVEGFEGLLGGGEKQGIWESVVAKLGDALSELTKQHGPMLIQAWREKIQFDAYVANLRFQERLAMSGAPVAPQPGPGAAPAHPSPEHNAAPPANTSAAAPAGNTGLPLPTGGLPTPPEYPGKVTVMPPRTQPTQTQAAAQGAEHPAEEEMFKAIQQKITNLIATCWEDQDGGGDAAITVKRVIKAEFSPLLGMLRTQFKDLNQLLDLAKKDERLAPISADPEFPEWAKEFHAEFMVD